MTAQADLLKLPPVVVLLLGSSCVLVRLDDEVDVVVLVVTDATWDVVAVVWASSREASNCNRRWVALSYRVGYCYAS